MLMNSIQRLGDMETIQRISEDFFSENAQEIFKYQVPGTEMMYIAVAN